MARSPAVGFPDYGDYFRDKLDKADEIRELLFGTSDIIQLGEHLGLPVNPRHIRKKKRKKDKKRKCSKS